MTTSKEEQAHEPLVFSLEEPVEVKSAPNRIECVADLESFTNLVKKINVMWGTRELDKLIQGLFMDSRDGARQGFPPPVAQELMFLSECNKMVRAIETAQKLGINVTDAHRMVEAGDQAFVTGGSPWNDPSASMDGSSREDSKHRETHRKSTLHHGIPVQSLGLEPVKPSKGPIFWLCVALIIGALIQLGLKLFEHFK
jgi:hypothetical protein